VALAAHLLAVQQLQQQNSLQVPLQLEAQQQHPPLLYVYLLLLLTYGHAAAGGGGSCCSYCSLLQHCHLLQLLCVSQVAAAILQQQHHHLVCSAAKLKILAVKAMLACLAASTDQRTLQHHLLLLLLLLLPHLWLPLCWGPFLCACWLAQSLGSWQSQEWWWWVLMVVCLRGSNVAKAEAGSCSQQADTMCMARPTVGSGSQQRSMSDQTKADSKNVLLQPSTPNTTAVSCCSNPRKPPQASTPNHRH
jgi:hypothetical protein